MPDLSQPELCLFIYVAPVGFEVFYDNHLCYLLFHFQIGGIKSLTHYTCQCKLQFAFLFQIGAIKSSFKSVNFYKDHEFQFQIGAIRRKRGRGEAR